MSLNGFRYGVLLAALVFSGFTAGAAPAEGEMSSSTLTVQGNAVVTTSPDRAVVQLGAVAEAEEAAAAQSQVNEVVAKALRAITDVGIPEKRIATSGLSLSPVYDHRQPDPARQPSEPGISGYRASNTIRVEIDNLAQVGKVIDAGVGAGANQLQGITFELKDDTSQRIEALEKALREARTKAEAMAAALGLQLDGVREVREGGVSTLSREPRGGGMRMMAAEAAPTPIQPGEVQTEASVTVRFGFSSAR